MMYMMMRGLDNHQIVSPLKSINKIDDDTDDESSQLGAKYTCNDSVYQGTNSYYDHSAPIARNSPENNQVRLLEYRHTKVASFRVDGKELICLPQAFELFLKNLVGGLHTVYTKLKRLDIIPIVCNVEQVRVLRGLGAIQPGVNRCKLISPREFDTLYEDCTNSASRPGRPPKRHYNNSNGNINDNDSENGSKIKLQTNMKNTKDLRCNMSQLSCTSSSNNSSPSSSSLSIISTNEPSTTTPATTANNYIPEYFNSFLNYSRFKPYQAQQQQQNQTSEFLLNNYRYPQAIYNNPYLLASSIERNLVPFVNQQNIIPSKRMNSCEQTYNETLSKKQQLIKNDKLHSNSHPLSIESLIGNNKIEENKIQNLNCNRQQQQQQGEEDEEEISQVKEVLKQEDSFEVMTIMEFLKKSVKSLDCKLQSTLNKLSLQLQNEIKLRYKMEKKAHNLGLLQSRLKRQLKIQRAIILLKKSSRKSLRLNR